MPVEIEKSEDIWTVIHNRPEARNAMDPDSAQALCDAFIAFDPDVLVQDGCLELKNVVSNSPNRLQKLGSCLSMSRRQFRIGHTQ